MQLIHALIHVKNSKLLTDINETLYVYQPKRYIFDDGKVNVVSEYERKIAHCTWQ